MGKWKVEQEERLKKKDEDEEIMKEKLREQARQELEDWYKRYESQLEKTKSTNREAESDFVAEVGGMNHIEPGSEWGEFQNTVILVLRHLGIQRMFPGCVQFCCN